MMNRGTLGLLALLPTYALAQQQYNPINDLTQTIYQQFLVNLPAVIGLVSFVFVVFWLTNVVMRKVRAQR